MTVARVRLRITEKATRRTYIGVYPWDASDTICCIVTGYKRFVTDRSGYSEFNERGEPVLDSWIERRDLVTLS